METFYSLIPSESIQNLHGSFHKLQNSYSLYVMPESSKEMFTAIEEDDVSEDDKDEDTDEEDDDEAGIIIRDHS